MDIVWRTLLAWIMYKRKRLERRNDERRLSDKRVSIFYKRWITRGSSDDDKCYILPSLEQQTQALEAILHWIRRCGMQTLEWAECVIIDRGVEPTDKEQHIKQLLELMEQEHWRTQYPPSPRTDDPDMDMSVSLRKLIFKTMLEEIPRLIGMYRRFEVRNLTLEARFSTTLDKILRLSSWTPSSTHNKHLRGLLKVALSMLNNLGDNEEYHDDLRDFMKRHTAFCAFTLDNADLITTEDSQTTAGLCKDLRRLAQNFGKIASTKAEQYQKLYENFIANKEDLSHWLDSASPGQGKLYL